MDNPVIEAAKARRSRYALGGALPVDEARIEGIVRGAMLEAPSSYNSQSARVAMLYGERHAAFWDFLIGKMPEMTAAMLRGFKAAHGTILFFEDRETVARLQAEHPRNAEVFPVFSLQSNAMLQWAVWTALAVEGVGANVQHFGELTEEWAADAGAAPASWKAIAQMPFGEILSQPGEKDRLPIEGRFRIFR